MKLYFITRIFKKIMKYFIKTLGCQMNYSDSERVAKILEQCGFTETKEISKTNLFIINTCSVKQKAENKAIGQIRSYKKTNPNSIIAVTGCMVRQSGDRNTSNDQLFKHEFIDLVFRIEDTAKLPKILEPHFPNYDFSEFENKFGRGSIENYFRIVPKVDNIYQVFVPIMQGCDKFCSYCIVPFTRGREISRPIKEIFIECEQLVENGAKEITLLGQNVNSYTDGGTSQSKKCFAKLLKKIDTLHSKGLSRLRFSSPHPQDFTDDVIETLVKIKTSCPHIHLPVQHGCNSMLKKMNRNYTIEKYEEIIKKIRKAIPNCLITTDIIVGFPDESENEFKELCNFAEKIKFSFAFTSIYSPRKNTPAGKMKKLFIDEKTKKERFHIFDDIVKKHAFAQRKSFVGKTLEVLVEKSKLSKNGLFEHTGRSLEALETWFQSNRPLRGQEVEIKITKARNYVLSGELKNK